MKFVIIINSYTDKCFLKEKIFANVPKVLLEKGGVNAMRKGSLKFFTIAMFVVAICILVFLGLTGNIMFKIAVIGLVVASVATALSIKQ